MLMTTPYHFTPLLQSESEILIDWFYFNCMKANPDKFQAIAVGKKKQQKLMISHLYLNWGMLLLSVRIL